MSSPPAVTSYARPSVTTTSEPAGVGLPTSAPATGAAGVVAVAIGPYGESPAAFSARTR
jgi:hypothetical protein